VTEPELPLHTLRVTCSTPGCPNSLREWECEAHLNADGLYRVICALCGHYITAIKHRGRSVAAKAFRP
jgi:hypothetical protein